MGAGGVNPLRFVASDIYSLVTSGQTWYGASQCSDQVRGDHLRRITAARRIAKGHARMYGEPWPIEGADKRDGQEAYTLLRNVSPEEIAERLDYLSVEEAWDHAQKFAEANDRKFPPPVPSGKGAQAYTLRKEENIPWEDIAEKLGYARSVSAIRAARQYAVAVGEKWPLTLPRIKVSVLGKDAYELRAKQVKWEDIGERLKRHKDSCSKAARQYARDNQLPWPPFEGPDGDKVGQEAYKRRETNFDLWSDIASDLGLATDACRRYAEIWAGNNNKQWPISAPKDFRRHAGKSAYERRAETFESWPDIGKALDRDEGYVLKAAKDHAEQHGLPWPVPFPEGMDPESIRRDTGLEAYKLREERRMGWVEIAETLEVSRAFAVRQAREHASRENKPWPIDIPDPSQERCYKLRSEGLSWFAVAAEVQIAVSTAQDRAKRWAKRSGLPWPVPVQSTVNPVYSEADSRM